MDSRFQITLGNRIINNWELRNREKKLDTQPCDSRIPYLLFNIGRGHFILTTWPDRKTRRLR